MKSSEEIDKLENTDEIQNEENLLNKHSLFPKNHQNLDSYKRVKNSIETNNRKIFENLSFYLDVYVGVTNISDCFIKIIESQGGKISKRVKGSNYIIFNDGKKSTVEKALEHDIQLVTPTWIHESTLSGRLLNVESYIIKKTFTDLFLENINKRRFKDISKGLTDYTSKTRKTTAFQTNDLDFETALTQTESNDNYKKKFNKDTKVHKKEEKDKEKEKEKEVEIKKNTKRINSKSVDKREESKEESKRAKSKKKKENKKESKKPKNLPIQEENKEVVNITCIDSSIFETQKISKICKNLGVYKYQELTFETIKNIKFFFVKKDTNMRSDIIKLHLLFSKQIDLYDVKYLYDSADSKKPIDMMNYKLEKTKFFESPSSKDKLDKLENSKIFDKYKFFFHESFKNEESEENNKLVLETLTEICEFLGGKVVDSLRLSDICIVKKKEKENFPPFIKIVNTEFLIDSIRFMKFPDTDEEKYSFKKVQKKKIKNK